MENDLLKQIASLSPEEREALKSLLSPPKKVEKAVVPPENARAKRVYWFEHNGKVNAHSVRSASKIYFTRKDYRYLGWSTGEAWKMSRDAGKSVKDAQDDEYKLMVSAGFRDPPPDLRDTNFGRGSSFALDKKMGATLNDEKDLEYKKELNKLRESYGKAGAENLAEGDE